VDDLPSSITHLSLGWLFQQQLHRLPSSLTHLTLTPNYRPPLYHLSSNIILKR